MGSKGWGALARIPYSSSVANLPSTEPFSSCRQSSLSARDATIVMRFWVRVPVLSVQSTVAAPSVSIAATRRVRTRAREMRQAPITMKTVRTSGNSSGSIDMPSAMTGEIAQTFEHALRAGFLNDGDQNRGAGKNAEHDGFLEIAEDQIDDGCAQQQREHRLAQDLEDNADKGAAVGLGEGVGPFRFKAGGGFLLGKAS